MSAPKGEESVREANAAVRMHLPFDNREDFDDARRGVVAPLSQPLITATDGRVVWKTQLCAKVTKNAIGPDKKCDRPARIRTIPDRRDLNWHENRVERREKKTDFSSLAA